MAEPILHHRNQSAFTRFSSKTARLAGHPLTFTGALLAIVIWGISGPIFGFSDTWQLVINTGTTIITFLMVFLIQNTQNRDSGAIHIKLDELIHSSRNANNALLDLEEMDEAELERIRAGFEHQAEQARDHLARRRQRGPADPGTPT